MRRNRDTTQTGFTFKVVQSAPVRYPYQEAESSKAVSVTPAKPSPPPQPPKPKNCSSEQ
jgi:hypothetical protein